MAYLKTSNNRKILCVGLTCLDIIQTCTYYPPEDSDHRSVDYRWQRGGNASNTCTVLSLLGSSCEFLGVLSKEEHSQFLKDDMKKYNIDFSKCQEVDGYRCPISTIILSLSTGTRTILHYNPNLPEITLENFGCLKLKNYSWIHFEGRNVTQVLAMMETIEKYNKIMKGMNEKSNKIVNKQFMEITVSLELEKPQPELLLLLPFADIVFISKDFAQRRGCDNMDEILENIGAKAKQGTVLICAWGDRGATARTSDGILVKSSAFPPEVIVDSLGAGDTFNAAVIDYLNNIKMDAESEEYNSLNNPTTISEHSLNKFNDPNILHAAIIFGCHIAGAKIGMKGYDGLVNYK
ncbi:PREDICTED: ketohexokinase-like [Polistes dominula]|uniref:Ketohexokinase-like n=1 Tax=Polistes dominula TaxID=743375 RepID=A0ABM1I5J4_POLDO|nr:PREDICTED: ketohexokinase-like [Polistes dominula]